MKKDRGACHIFKGLKKQFSLVTLRLSLKRFTAGVFVVLFKSLSQKNMAGTNVF